MTVIYADGVFEELVDLSFYIAENDEEAARRFLDACDEMFRFLAENRLIGSQKAVRKHEIGAGQNVARQRVREISDFLRASRNGRQNTAYHTQRAGLQSSF